MTAVLLAGGLVLSGSIASEAAVASPSSSFTVVSKTAVLKAPKIANQPKSIRVLHGETATFRVKAKGGGLKYQWYRITTPLSGAPLRWVKIPKATKSAYSVRGTLPLHSSKYRVVVTNRKGKKVSASATLKVGTSFIRGTYEGPARTRERPFRPHETAFLTRWAVSVDATTRAARGDRTALSLRIHAYSGLISTAMWLPTTRPASAHLRVSFVSAQGDVYDATLSGLIGSPKKGYGLTATASVPDDHASGVWLIYDTSVSPAGVWEFFGTS